MKRLTIVGVCLAAVFALTAVMASSAFASGGPEYMICAKANPKGTGHWKNKTCSEEEASGKGGYERVSWEKAKKKTYKGKNIGTPKNYIVDPLETPAGKAGVTECTKEKVEGEVTSATTQKWHTVYTKCLGNGVACNTKGAKAGEIKTEELEAELAYLNKEHTKVGLRVKGPHSAHGLLAQYECPKEEANIEVYGEVFAEVTGNLNSANKKTKTVAAEGTDGMQSVLYPEAKHSEAQGKQYFEWGYAFKKCVTEEVEKGVPLETAEGICVVKAGGFWESYPEVPVTLISVVTKGGKPYAEAPATQNGTTESSGEAFLIAT